MNKVFKRFMHALTIALAVMTVVSQASSSAARYAVQAAPPDDEIEPDFCDEARAKAAACWYEYEACGGAEGDGCWDALQQCLEDSGIWQCE